MHHRNVVYQKQKQKHSLCSFCSWPTVVPYSQITLHPPAAEARLPGLQRAHPRTRSLEMSVHGFTPDGHR